MSSVHFSGFKCVRQENLQKKKEKKYRLIKNCQYSTMQTWLKSKKKKKVLNVF